MGATDTPESLTGRVNATFRRRLHMIVGFGRKLTLPVWMATS